MHALVSVDHQQPSTIFGSVILFHLFLRPFTPIAFCYLLVSTTPARDFAMSSRSLHGDCRVVNAQSGDDLSSIDPGERLTVGICDPRPHLPRGFHHSMGGPRTARSRFRIWRHFGPKWPPPTLVPQYLRKRSLYNRSQSKQPKYHNPSRTSLRVNHGDLVRSWRSAYRTLFNWMLGPTERRLGE